MRGLGRRSARWQFIQHRHSQRMETREIATHVLRKLGHDSAQLRYAALEDRTLLCSELTVLKVRFCQAHHFRIEHLEIRVTDLDLFSAWWEWRF
jgi:hypothetical protein